MECTKHIGMQVIKYTLKYDTCEGEDKFSYFDL